VNIGHGRLSQLFERLFGVKGVGGPENVLSDVMPVLDVWSDCPDTRFARGERIFGVKMTSLVQAARYSFLGVDAVNGFLAVIEQVQVYKATASQVFVRMEALASGGSTLDAATSFDGRFASGVGTTAGQSPVEFGTVLSVAGVGGFGCMVPANSWTVLPLPKLVLVPGASLVVENGTINEAVSVQLVGYARKVDEAELRA
jgi:hypothetical protein